MTPEAGELAEPDYPDRDQWPGYWRGIRRAIVVFAVAIVVIVATEPLRSAAEGHPLRLALVTLLAVGVGLVVEFIGDRIAKAWDRRVDRR